MKKSEIFAEVLRKIILEIRLLSSSGNESSSINQINKLANMAHNLPLAIIDGDKFDLTILKNSLKEYVEKYPSSGIFEDFLKKGV